MKSAGVDQVRSIRSATIRIRFNVNQRTECYLPLDSIMDKKDLGQIKEKLSKSHKAVLTLHLSPDPDSIGSVLALAEVLKRHKHDVSIYSHDPIPEDFMFLPGAESIIETNLNELDWTKFDIFWALDIAASDRNGFKGNYPENLTVVNIDHHITNTQYGAVNLILDAPSTASILFDIFRELGEDLDENIAKNLMMGLVGDTGFFSYVGSEGVFRMAAELMKAGADYRELRRNLSQNVPYEAAIVTGEVLAGMQLVPDQRVLYAVISEAHIRAVGKMYYEIKGTIARYLQSVKEADWGFIVVEDTPSTSKITLRSKDPKVTDTSKIAQVFGGGGHPVASGATVERKPAQEIVQDVLKAAEEIFSA